MRRCPIISTHSAPMQYQASIFCEAMYLSDVAFPVVSPADPWLPDKNDKSLLAAKFRKPIKSDVSLDLRHPLPKDEEHAAEKVQNS